MTGARREDLACRSVVAVCAHPDDESFGLGAVLSTLAGRGATTRVFCFTHGEASTLGGDSSELATVRAHELGAAAAVLGVQSVRLRSYPDGGLAQVDLDELCRDVVDFTGDQPTDCLVVFDEGGITGHPDHQRATEVALVIAARLGLPVLAWALPATIAASLNAEFGASFLGRQPSEIDLTIEVDRRLQHQAISCHASQSSDNPVLWRRLALQGGTESLRWLRVPRRSAP